MNGILLMLQDSLICRQYLLHHCENHWTVHCHSSDWNASKTELSYQIFFYRSRSLVFYAWTKLNCALWILSFPYVMSPVCLLGLQDQSNWRMVEETEGSNECIHVDICQDPDTQDLTQPIAGGFQKTTKSHGSRSRYCGKVPFSFGHGVACLRTETCLGRIGLSRSF